MTVVKTSKHKLCVTQDVNVIFGVKILKQKVKYEKNGSENWYIGLRAKIKVE